VGRVIVKVMVFVAAFRVADVVGVRRWNMSDAGSAHNLRPFDT
jgi:hypothetical protein